MKLGEYWKNTTFAKEKEILSLPFNFMEFRFEGWFSHSLDPRPDLPAGRPLPGLWPSLLYEEDCSVINPWHGCRAGGRRGNHFSFMSLSGGEKAERRIICKYVETPTQLKTKLFCILSIKQ